MLLHASTCQHMAGHASTCYYMLLHASTCYYMPVHASTCQYMPVPASTCCMTRSAQEISKQSVVFATCIGTGSNVSYMEQLERVEKWEGEIKAGAEVR